MEPAINPDLTHNLTAPDEPPCTGFGLHRIEAAAVGEATEVRAVRFADEVLESKSVSQLVEKDSDEVIEWTVVVVYPKVEIEVGTELRVDVR
jgi:hypothetical protein